MEKSKLPTHILSSILLFLLVIAFTVIYATPSRARPLAENSLIRKLPGDSIEATIAVRFVVAKDGTVSKFDIVKTKCKCNPATLDSIKNEVKRIITSNPPPPKTNKKGEPIESYYKQTIVFKIG
jgi:hypothetical protein